MDQHRPIRSVLKALGAVLCLVTLLGGSLPLPGPDAHAAPIEQAGGAVFAFEGFGGQEATAAVALGDVNGDGPLDMVVGNDGQNYVYLYAGSGTGPASWTRVSLGGGEDTRSVALGDLNGDGRLDVVAGNEGQSYLYLSVGTDGWTETQLGSPRATRSVALGDLNGDGRLDVVTGNWGQPNELYVNGGQGRFVGTPFGTSDYTSSVAVGDLDQDGDLDVVAARWSQSNAVYSNDGRGKLAHSATFGGADLTTSMAVADLSGDGWLDLIAGNRGQNRVYANDGEGGLIAGTLLGDEDRTQSVGVGDLNGDGLLDVVVGNRDQHNVVYLNDGRLGASSALGSLSAASVLPSEDWTESVAIGDLDGDGHLDIAAGNAQGQSGIYFYRGAGDSPAQLGHSLLIGDANQTRGVAVGDMDGDGRLDIIAGNRGRNTIVYNDGRTFGAGISFGADLTESVALGDMDGNGTLDLVAGNQARNILYLNLKPGQPPSGRAFGDVHLTHSVAVGDLDNDGDLDVVAGNERANQVYLNDGQGNLAGAALDVRPEDARVTLSVALGDLDGDGCLDIVAGNEGPNQVYLNVGQGTFMGGTSFGAQTTRGVALGDLNGDGRLDVVAGNLNQQSQVYLNLGTGHLAAGMSFGEIERTDSLALGDLNGDGQLDVVTGNWGDQNRVYLNDGTGHLAASLLFGGADDADSVALGDLDGDGSLDIVTGIYGHRNSVHFNRGAGGLIDHASYPTLIRPGPTANAGSYSSPIVLSGSTLSVDYSLFDREGDAVRFVRALYSPDGGGRWFPATAASGTITTLLSTRAPVGDIVSLGTGDHVYHWQVDADLVRSDNVVLRIEAYQGYSGPGPYQWPYIGAQSFPFRVAAPWYAKVVDQEGRPLAEATLYADGVPISSPHDGPSRTDRAGLLGLDEMEVGTRLAALAPVYEGTTSRGGHDGWAYRTYLTSEPFTVAQAGEQRLVLRRDQPLVLFNLIVSIEWDASAAYVAQIARAIRSASNYVYDLTDGQMAFGQVAIYDDAQHWADADLQISAKNIVRPHAYIGGLTSDDHSHVIRVGRFWDGFSGNAGAWDRSDGYRTLGHEFGHYALHLYDEYFAYQVDQRGFLVGEVPAWCTGPENREPGSEATNASAMDYQYTSSELSARNVPGLWSPLCKETAQWQFNEESAWETLSRVYADHEPTPGWHFTTPLNRGHVLSGPEALRDDLPSWPQIETHVGASIPVRTLRVRDAQGPYQGALVALYTNQHGHPVAIDQGFTNAEGAIDVYGARPGDTLRAASFDGALGGAVSVDEGISYALSLVPAAGLQALAVPERYPQLTLRPSSDGRQLYLRLSGVGPGGHLAAIVAQTGGTSLATALSYSSALGGYEGLIQLAATGTRMGTGTAQVIGTAGNGQGVSLGTGYALQFLPRTGVSDLYSADGNVHLHAMTGTLPVDAYLVLGSTNAIPAQLPLGKRIVGNAYDLCFSGAQTQLSQPALLRLHYDRSLLEPQLAQARAADWLRLGLYRWDVHAEQWTEITGSVDREQHVLAAPIRYDGTYVLMALPVAWTHEVYLPAVLR